MDWCAHRGNFVGAPSCNGIFKVGQHQSSLGLASFSHLGPHCWMSYITPQPVACPDPPLPPCPLPAPPPVVITMVHRRQTCPGASMCSSDCQRRRNRSVSGGKYFAPLVTRLAAKHRMLVSRRRRLPLSVNIVNRASTSPVSPPPSSPPPPMAPVLLEEAPAEYVRDKLHLFKKWYVNRFNLFPTRGPE